jgi:DDE superfamily endonuclease
VHPKLCDWYNWMMHPYSCSERQFKNIFRMNKATFNVIVHDIAPFYEKPISVLGGRPAVKVELAVCMAIYRLASTETVRAIAYRFGVGKSTCEKTTEAVYSIIVQHLMQKYVKWPTPEEQVVISEGFERKRGIPGVIGAVDGSHLPIELVNRKHNSDFFNRKKFHSIVLQAVVNDKYLFTDLYIGWPGSVSDARVWRNSPLFHRAIQEAQRTPNEKDRTVFYDGNFLLGDKAYPLSEFLLPPFKRYEGQPVHEKLYNYLHSSTRMIVENVFGRLKARFRRVGTKLNNKSPSHVQEEMMHALTTMEPRIPLAMETLPLHELKGSACATIWLLLLKISWVVYTVCKVPRALSCHL